jgi:cobalt-zinc-cadmium efflux system outer membrane protein
MRRLAAVVLLLLLAITPAARAQEHADTTVPLTLAGAIDSALRRSPDLLVSRSAGDSARAELRIARALPNPQIAAVPNTPFQYSATIALDIGPQRTSRTRVAALAIDAATADTRDLQRQVSLNVARLYEDVLLADARRRLTLGRRDILRQLVAADSSRVRAGDLPERALIRSQIELIKGDADVARAGVDAETSRLGLEIQMGDARLDTARVLADSLTYRDIDFDARADHVLVLTESRPDVVAARVREAQSEAAEHLAASLRVPVPQLSYVQQFGGPFQTGRYSAFGIGFELPIVNAYGGQRDRAAASRIAAQGNVQRASSLAARDAIAALAEFRAQRGLVRRYESGVISKVSQNVEATRYAYARGAAPLLEVLDALRAQQDVLTDYYTALHDYWVSVHGVRAALAVPLP